MPNDLFRVQTPPDLPAPPTNLQPVHFDFGASSNAESALREGADVVDRSQRSRVADARAAEAKWTGAQHSSFVSSEADTSGKAADLVRQLRDAADKLEHAAAAAKAENARRATALHAWHKDAVDARDRLMKAQAKEARR